MYMYLDTPPRARAPEVEGLHAAAQILQQLVAFLQIELHFDVISELDEREADVVVLSETLEQPQHEVAYRVPRVLLVRGGCRVQHAAGLVHQDRDVEVPRCAVCED